MRTVPRHRFVPDATSEDAYADIAVIPNRGADGVASSCASVPTIVAMMLDQLASAPATASWKSAPQPATPHRGSPPARRAWSPPRCRRCAGS
ncbi:MAG: hypothetical protein GEU83_00190 [Pseudonocardiaceae bacterium]|nr:hypothetical protein [Pseudonocardiaceae bacterium]